MENIISHSNEILVSVVVVTYNSSSTVLETLDSIANQSYYNIELIISDDCSTDNTVMLCQNWLEIHSSRFEGIELITSDKNTGTSGNLNRGIKKCKGLWIKSIAGDDRLLPDCISQNIQFVTFNPDTDLLFSKVKYFGDLRLLEGHRKFNYRNFDLQPDEFYKKLLQSNFLPASSVFMKSDLFQRIGLYDESIPLMEDWPFWMKAGYNNCHFSFMDVDTVEYRVQESVSLSKNASQKYLDCEKKAFKQSLLYMREFSFSLWLRTIIFSFFYRSYCLLKNNNN